MTSLREAGKRQRERIRTGGRQVWEYTAVSPAFRRVRAGDPEVKDSQATLQKQEPMRKKEEMERKSGRGELEIIAGKLPRNQ